MSKIESIAIETIKDAAFRCMKCGLCQSECPVYRETKNESLYARGKLSIIEAVLSGRLPLDKEVRKRLMTCLECRRCEAACPSGVRVHEISRYIKHEISKRGRQLWIKKVLFKHLFPYNWRFRLLARVGGFLTRAFFPTYGRYNPLRLLFPLFGLAMDRNVPHLSYNRKKLGIDSIPVVRDPVAKFVLFAGCGSLYLYNRVIAAAIRVLSRLGVQVVFLDDLGCCGAPVEASGELEIFEEMRDRNAKLLNAVEADGVVTVCATCGLELKENYYGAGAINKPVYDICEVLDRYLVPEAMALSGSVVTWHDPCHLNRGQGISKEPREIIERIDGVEYREMREADACCGCAGFFTATHYHLARLIRGRKINNIEAVRPNIVVTDCPGCMMHIEEGAKQKGLSYRTLHIVELVDMAMSSDAGSSVRLVPEVVAVSDERA